MFDFTTQATIHQYCAGPLSTHQMRLMPKAGIIFVSVVVAPFLCASCGDTGSANENNDGWQLVSVELPRTLVVGKAVGYCAGYPRPTIRHPQILYQGSDVYITAKVKWPHRPSKGDLCLDSELLVMRKIVLRRDLEDVKVYDRGVEPPELRWPSEQLRSHALKLMRRRDQVRQVHWKTYGAPREKTVRIISEVGYCAGTEKPRIRKVRTRERKHRVLLTAFLTEPSRGNGEGCAGVGYGVRKVVRLRQPLGSRALYDASFSPPKQRWPKS